MSNSPGQIGTSTDPIPARLAALKITPMSELKQLWRELFDTEPPGFNRRYIESRLAYRLQEIAYGGLRPDTVRRLEALGEELDGGDVAKRRVRHDRKLLVGTRLIREWRGTEHVVTVLADSYEYEGRRYKSLSAIARCVTGTRWSGPLFFGLVNPRRRG
jgi:Protein of unknown function (DUF2924)